MLFCMGESTGEPLEQRGHTKQGTAADALHKAGDTAPCFKASLQCPEEHICHRACRQAGLRGSHPSAGPALLSSHQLRVIRKGQDKQFAWRSV